MSKLKCQNYNSKVKSFKLSAAILSFTFYVLSFAVFSKTASAITDPLAVPNNKFGIHIIQATPDESSPSAGLVNSSGGNWGYITVLVKSTDRDHNKWQEFFNDLRRRHLIPLVRLATQPEESYWKRPYEKEEQAWADFLDALNWPTKNRYIIIYNEPNHAKEWGNKVDASSYAKTLDQTITALKNKNSDFFVLNAGLDASAPSVSDQYEDEAFFIKEMNTAVPGIFQKLDGWASHSYPNPGFVGSPSGSGRGTIGTWFWEIQQLRDIGVDKNLPIFITETGWRHAEGLDYDPKLPNTDTVAKYYQQAFQNAWKISRIVAVTPFLLSYQETPFDHFSFRRIDSSKQDERLLGLQFPDSKFYPMYQVIADLPKVAGRPTQEIKTELTKGEVYSSIVAGETYAISLTFKNTGQSIWNDGGKIKLAPIEGGENLGITGTELPSDKKVEPGQEYTFSLNLKAPQSGIYKISFNLFEGDKQFDSKPVQFTTQVKSPVILKIMGALGWKKDFSGSYILRIKGVNGEKTQNITLNKEGVSGEIEARYLLPDYLFQFSLEKQFYIPKTFYQKVHTGVNTLDFGTLQPDIFSVLLKPAEFWKISPFSN